MNEFRQFSTGRLALRAVRAADANHIYWLNSDPRAWAHRPSGVHITREQTKAQIAGYIEAWNRDGLGCWAARTHDGTFVGIGGCSVKDGIGWNLHYRFLPEAQGRGYEAELVRAAMIAASEVRPELPIVTLTLEHNAPSRAVAENAGLTEVWRGPDEDDENPDAVRLVYADRELPADVIEALRAYSEPRPRPAHPALEQARAGLDTVPPVPEEPAPAEESPDGRAVLTKASAGHERLGHGSPGLQAAADQTQAAPAMGVGTELSSADRVTREA